MPAGTGHALSRGYALRALLIGRRVPFGPNGELSAIAKTPAHCPLELTPLGLWGDEVGDSQRHGGLDKAIHHYPFEHYREWASELGRALEVGAFGENFSTLGMNETCVCVGDVWRIGSALLQISQGRQPCWKLGVRFGDATMPRRLQDSGRTGWYYRVLEAGQIMPGDSLRLVVRPRPEWPLSRLTNLLYRDRLSLGDLQQMATLPELSASWRNIALKRLQLGRVEDFSPRLHAPPARPWANDATVATAPQRLR